MTTTDTLIRYATGNRQWAIVHRIPPTGRGWSNVASVCGRIKGWPAGSAGWDTRPRVLVWRRGSQIEHPDLFRFCTDCKRWEERHPGQ